MDDNDATSRAAHAKKGSPFLNTEQAAFYLGLCPRRLQALRSLGNGPRFRRHKVEVASGRNVRITEEFAEDVFSGIDIRNNITIDCNVEQAGFRTASLREILKERKLLKPRKKLKFSVVSTDIALPYGLFWKVLNRGQEAINRDCIRGQIVADDGHKRWSETTTLVVSGYMKGFDPGATAQKHRDTAADLWAIRESYLSLLTDMTAGAISDDVARERRDSLQEALAAIYKSAPGTTPEAYDVAQKGLQTLEDYTFNEGEIDKFLPRPLKRGA